tara:strand:+ start:1508 stop:2680 length:1173 start_codon:yes stop_codon:yes gene_type:complete
MTLVPSREMETSARTGLIKLTLSSFRSYKSLSLSCDARPVILTGANGAGKTNILEALSFLGPGRGLRSAKLSLVTYAGEPPLKESPFEWSISSHFQTPEGVTSVGTGLEISEGRERRVVKIDDDRGLPQTALSQVTSILWLTPQMDRLFVEGTSARRKFMDRLVYLFDRSHAARVARYDYTMRERLKLLKQGRHEDAWLSSLEAKMAESSIAIAAARRTLVERLMQAKVWALGVFPRPRLEIEGVPEDLLETLPALSAEERLQSLYKANRLKDYESGRTQEGSHKTDLRVWFTEKNMPAELCSTGEQKALLISIIMAAARLQAAQEGLVPLVLFDEVVAHLDEQRRQALFDEILHLRMQAWMTGTDRDLFLPLNDQVQHFEVEKSTLTPV